MGDELSDEELEIGNTGIGNIFTLAIFNNQMPALEQRQAEASGGGRENDKAMGGMRILRGMILARRRKGKDDFGRQTSDFGD